MMEQLINWLAGLIAAIPWWPWPPESSAALIIWVIYAVVLALVVPPVAMIILTWLERKIIARIQNRIGPNRAGPFGMLQAVADTIKMLTKEDITPTGADRIPYNIGPGLVAISAILVYAVLPVAPGFAGANLNVGLIYIMAVGSFSILGILMAGWSSNNKFALLGAFRAVSQLVAYEIPMMLALITVAVVAGSMDLNTISEAQAWSNGGWYVIAMPLTFTIFFLSGVAETGRCPFDLLEAESEIVAGFHVEYSGLKFGLFMIGEYVHMLAVATLLAILFLGGWSGPFVAQAVAVHPLLGAMLGLFYFLAKTGLFVFLMIWIRGTLFRFRIDHLLDFGWKFLTPLALFNLMFVAFVVKMFQQGSNAFVPLPAGPLAQFNFSGWGQTIGLLLASILTIIVVSMVVRSFARRSQKPGMRAVAGVNN